MITELAAQAGQKLLETTPPDGREYWAARFWDRAAAEQHEVLAPDFAAQKDQLRRYLATHGAGARRSLEFACGTGDFTAMTAELTSASSMVAVDVSREGLARTRAQVDRADLELVCGDFWADHGLGTADLVVCVDAIHHLGDVEAVVRRLTTFVEPGGVLVGNVLTRDRFHEFGRKRYGRWRHARNTASFLAAAVMIRLSGGRWRAGAYRTQLRDTADVEALLADVSSEVLDVQVDPYFTAFAVRV